MAETAYTVKQPATFGGDIGSLIIEWQLTGTNTGAPYQCAMWEKITIHLYGATAGIVKIEGSLEDFSLTMSDFSNFATLSTAGDPATPVLATLNFDSGSPPKIMPIHGPVHLVRPNASSSLTGTATIRMLLQTGTQG